jgi:hypothetical protein
MECSAISGAADHKRDGHADDPRHRSRACYLIIDHGVFAFAIARPIAGPGTLTGERLAAYKTGR